MNKLMTAIALAIVLPGAAYAQQTPSSGNPHAGHDMNAPAVPDDQALHH